MDTAGTATAISDAVTQGSPNNGSELKGLEKQVQKARQLVHQSEIKVEAIEASMHEIEKFYPKIKIIRPADRIGGDGISLFAEKMLITVA